MLEVTYNSCGARQECMLDENFEKHGYCLVYDRTNQLRKVCFYVHGSREGSYVSWHSNRVVKCIRTYKEDIPVAMEEEYDRHGNLLYRMNWDSIDRKIFQGESITTQDFCIYHPRFATSSS